MCSAPRCKLSQAAGAALRQSLRPSATACPGAPAPQHRRELHGAAGPGQASSAWPPPGRAAAAAAPPLLPLQLREERGEGEGWDSHTCSGPVPAPELGEQAGAARGVRPAPGPLPPPRGGHAAGSCQRLSLSAPFPPARSLSPAGGGSAQGHDGLIAAIKEHPGRGLRQPALPAARAGEQPSRGGGEPTPLPHARRASPSGPHHGQRRRASPWPFSPRRPRPSPTICPARRGAARAGLGEPPPGSAPPRSLSQPPPAKPARRQRPRASTSLPSPRALGVAVVLLPPPQVARGGRVGREGKR